MTLNLSKSGETLSATVETVIVRVTQNYKTNGSVELTIHTAEWLILPDGSKQEIGQWTRHSATYPDIDTMVTLTALTWGKPRSEAEKALSDYGDILNAALAAMAARDAQEQ